MDRKVVRYVAVSVASLALAAGVVALGAFALPAPVYPALVVAGAGVVVAGVHVSEYDWDVLFGVWPPWVLAFVLDPTPALAGGLLAGAVGGVLAVPVVLRVGEAADALVN